MKKIFLGMILSLIIVGCGEKTTYPIFTHEEKKEIYKEAKDNNNEEKLKEIDDLMKKLEILGKKGDKTAEAEHADWHEIKIFYRAPKRKDPGANLLNRKW